MSLAPRRRGKRPAITWDIETREDGLVSVVQGGRPVLTGVPMSTARSYVRNRAKSTDRIFVVAPDGYRSKA